jgi:rubrerythrin
MPVISAKAVRCAAPAAPSERELIVQVLEDLPSEPLSHGALTRAAFLRRIVLGASASSAVTVAVLGLPTLAASSPSAQQDQAILNYALTLERMQAEFYAQALRGVALHGELRQFVEVVGGHERAHAAHLGAELGSAAERPRRFDFSAAMAGAEQVRATAIALEDLALEGYNGQAPNLTRVGLRTVLRIVSVEARHASWARSLAGELPAPRAVDPLVSEQQVRKGLRGAGIRIEGGP